MSATRLALPSLSPRIGPLDPSLEVWDDGSVRLVGTRMAFHWVVTASALHGDSAEEIAEHYGDIPLATVNEALAFYLANRETVDAWVQDIHRYEDQIRSEWEREHPGPAYSVLSARLANQDPSAATVV